MTPLGHASFVIKKIERETTLSISLFTEYQPHKDQPGMKSCIHFKTGSILKCRRALAFNFFSLTHFNIFVTQEMYILCLKKIMSKILTDFCLRVCNLWITVSMHVHLLVQYTYILVQYTYILVQYTYI